MFLSASTAVGAALVLDACKRSSDGPDDVTVVEDLMREHGVLRRALVVYREMAMRLRVNPGAVPPYVVQRTATLFRLFGEEYHERRLEEENIFPTVKKRAGSASAAIDTLVAQHARGREITAYILSAAQGPKIGANATALADVLDSFARMYEQHAAVEDTLIFPAWKKALSPGQVADMGDRFEEIEKDVMGKDGFECGVDQMTSIETALGLSDLVVFTAPTPPTTA
jgi:hemerythrin-like domain-containing protein